MTEYLDVADLIEIAHQIIGPGVRARDVGLLSAAAARPATVVFGHEAYVDPWAKGAALLHSLCMNHALIDGNKRLAWAAARIFLALNGVALADVDVDDAEAFMLSVARGELAEVEALAARFRFLYRAG